MRHTDMRLTMGCYTDARIFNLAGAVERLPIFAEGAEKVAKAVGDGIVMPQNQAGKGNCLDPQYSALNQTELHPVADMAGYAAFRRGARAGGAAIASGDRALAR